MAKTIAYARVSTNKQELDRQLDILDKHGYDKLITEKITGTKKDREGLDELLKWVDTGDTVIVESLSRLGRNTINILTIVEELSQKGVNFISFKENFDTSTPTGKAMLGMMAVISQLERDLTVERVKEGLESAKARGRVLGRPKADQRKINQALKYYDGKKHSIAEITTLTGISKTTLYRELRKREDKALVEEG